MTANLRLTDVLTAHIWRCQYRTVLLVYPECAYLRKWQADDPDIQEKVGYSQTEQKRIRDVTIFLVGKGAFPERRKVGTALQSSQNQERHSPQSYDEDGRESKSIENGAAA